MTLVPQDCTEVNRTLTQADCLPLVDSSVNSLVACCLQIVIELYRLLEKINREVQHMHHIDTICDFLYPLL